MKRIHKTLAKVDARLNLLLTKSLPQLEKMKKADTDGLQKFDSRLKELLNQWKEERDEKKKEKLHKIINEKIENFPTPITFGLHFPKHNLKEAAQITRIKEPFISALLKANASVKDLQSLGVHVRNQSGEIFTCFIPWAKLSRLVALRGVEYIELARPHRHSLGQAIPYAQINSLHAAPDNLTGAGVIVGIVDSPLDIYHRDFRIDDGTGGDGLGSSRVLFLWDQRLGLAAGENRPPVDPVLPGFGFAGGAAAYGVEYTQANINNELNGFTPAAPNAYRIVRHQPGVDPDTGRSISEHGTHVAGCAAGNGRSGAVGAAPGADIIYVNERFTNDSQTSYVYADSTFLLDAFAYIFARASLLGRPCVVNRSGSDNMGPHDGSTLGEQFLDNLLLTPGRVMTFAAGNTNDKTETLLGTVAPGGTTTITIFYNNAENNDEFELWYDGHDRFDIHVAIPTTPVTNLNVTAGTSGSVTLPNGVIATVVSVLNDPRNGDNRITLFLENVTEARLIPNGDWVLTVTGSTVINGAFSSWLERNNRGTRILRLATVNTMSIASPATGLRVIAVGSHNDIVTPPAIAASSSCGPTRDGRIKPDIATVGVSVVSSNSRNMNVTLLPVPALTASKSGTSMASPIVAGTCALLFECRGAGLSWFDMKQILQNNVGMPAAGIPSNQFGFGFLQISGGCTDFVNDVDVWLRDASDDIGVEPYAGAVAWRSPDIEVLDMLENPVSNPTHDPANFVNNIIRVTARNRSVTQIARNVEVFLYWADPGTAIAFPADWKNDGIYTGTAPNFVNQSNKIVIPQIPAGGSATVDFAWAPPAPGSNVRGDDHFCLLARLEHEGDQSNIGAGGWGIIRGSNNIALRNIHVVAVSPDGDADSAFYVTGTSDTDTLEVSAEHIDTPVKLTMPVEILPWRDIKLAEKHGIRKPYGHRQCGVDPLKGVRKSLRPGQLFEITGIVNADKLEIHNGIAVLHFTPKKGKVLRISHLNIAPGMKAAVRIHFSGLRNLRDAAVHIGQLSGGVRQTGVTIQPVKKLQKSRVKSVVLDGKKLVIK